MNTLQSKKAPMNTEEAIGTQSSLIGRLNLSQKLMIGFAVPIVLMAFLAFGAYTSTQSLVENNRWVEHTHKVITQGHRLEKLILRMETGERGFLITGKDSFLQPFNNAFNTWKTEIKSTKQLVSDNPEQVKNLDNINKKATSWLQQTAQPQIELRRKVKNNLISLDHIELLLREKTGKDILDNMREVATEIEQEFAKGGAQRAQGLLISVLKDMVDQETGERGFLITGEDSFLLPFHEGKTNFHRHINELKVLVANAPNRNDTKRLISEAEALSLRWLKEFATPEISLRRQLPTNANTSNLQALKKPQELSTKGAGVQTLSDLRNILLNLKQLFLLSGSESELMLTIEASKNVVDQEIGYRGFIFSGKDSFLQTYHEGMKSFKNNIAALQNLNNQGYNKNQVQEKIEILEDLESKWHLLAADVEIEARRTIDKTGSTPIGLLQRAIDKKNSGDPLESINQHLASLNVHFTNHNHSKGVEIVTRLEKNLMQLEKAYLHYLINKNTDQKNLFESIRFANSELIIQLSAYINTVYSNQDLLDIQVLINKLNITINNWLLNHVEPNLYKKSIHVATRSTALSHIQDVLRQGVGKGLLDDARELIYNINDDFTKANNITGSNLALNLGKNLVDQETGERGFIITGEESFLEPYKNGKKNVGRIIVEMENIANNAFDVKSILHEITDIEHTLHLWIEEVATPKIEKKRKGNSVENTTKIIADIKFGLNQLKQIFIKAESKHAQRVLLQVATNITNMETGLRGYLLTGEDQFILPFEQAKINVHKNIVTLQNIVALGYNKTSMLEKIDQLNKKATQWRVLAAEPEISLRRKLDQLGATMLDITHLIESGNENKLTEDIKQDIHAFIAIEKQLIANRIENAEYALNRANTLIILGGLISILATYGFGRYLLRVIMTSTNALMKGTKRVASGDFSQSIEVKSDDEFGQLAYGFNIMVQNLEKSTEAMSKSRNELSKQTDQLIQKNAEIETSNANLIIVKEEVEQKARDLVQVSQYKSDFLATMSHEIRTPMNGVLGMLGLLLKTELSGDQQRKAKIAYSSAQSLLTVINDILDFSKVDAGKMELEIIDFDLRTMIEDLVKSMAVKAEEKNLELVLNLIRVDHSMVKGDPGRIRQILTNLIGNALKFTDSGEVIIRANLKNPDNGRLLFHCDIIDTGIGIPENKQENLFQAFTQADASTTRKYGGTGLGLSIVSSLCKLMGGSVEVKSNAHCGSCFTVTLELESSAQSQPIRPTVNTSNLNLLVVDDNATNREVIRGQLEYWGATVTEAASASEALNLCHQNSSNANHKPFDIALLDMQMPEMDGAELGRKLKSNSNFNEMKLIMMTSMDRSGDAQYFADLGFSGYFSKPVTTSDLFDALSVIAVDDELLTQANPLITKHFVRSLAERTDQNTWPHNSRLLLVEDNQINQQVAKDIIESLGLSLDIAGNGLEALYALRAAEKEDCFSLILMDCQMPEMDGYEATQAIREGKAGNGNRSIPIIAMTANAMSSDRENCLAAGMNDYISKPVDPDVIEQVLKKWLLSQQPIGTSSSGEPPVEPLNQIWDQAIVLKRLNGRTERLCKLIIMYLDHTPETFQMLQQSIQQRDYQKVSSLAHEIKGMAANLGGNKVRKFCEDTERAVKGNDNDAMDTAYTALYKSNEEFIAEIKKYVNSPPAI